MLSIYFFMNNLCFEKISLKERGHGYGSNQRDGRFSPPDLQLVAVNGLMDL
jgi:hypothetical protein